MNFNKILTLTLISSLVFASCSKDPVESTDTNTVSTTPATNKCDYSPYSVGSSFTSEVAVKSILDGKWSYTEHRGNVTGTQTLNGKVWSIGKGFFPADTAKTQSSDGYVRCDDKGAYTFLKGAIYGKDLEAPILQYPLTKGKTWKSSSASLKESGYTFTSYYEYKVLNVGLTKKVKANTYKDVVEIEESLVQTIYDGIDTEIVKLTYLRCFDKTVGHIQTIFFFDNPFTGVRDTASMQSLVSYTIK